MNILPLFVSHFSLGRSILTLEKAGSTKETYPDSIIDLALNNNIKDLYLCEETMASFPEAYENCQDAKLNLRFGLKLICCQDIKDKSEDSLKTNHKIIIFAKNTQGYYDLIRIWTLAATEGKYYVPRIDQENLKKFWTNNLFLAIPFYDSFLFRNNLENARCTPSFEFTKPVFFIENNSLPFDQLMEEIVREYIKINNFESQITQTIYYKDRKDIKAYCTFRCINNRSTLSSPKLNHFSSAEFCLESYLEKINNFEL